MRTTVDIPDPIYRDLKSRAALEGRTVKEIILQSVISDSQRPAAQARKKRLKFPLLPSKQPGSLQLGEEGVYEYIPFP